MLISKRRTTLAGALLGVAVLWGCDSFGPEEPDGPGAIFVDLQSPFGHEGAAVFEVQDGSGLGEVTSMGGWVFQEQMEDGVRVVVIMTIPGPIQFQLGVDDVGSLPSVSLVQVAGPENQLRESLEGYEVDLFEMAERGGR